MNQAVFGGVGEDTLLEPLMIDDRLARELKHRRQPIACRTGRIAYPKDHASKRTVGVDVLRGVGRKRAVLGEPVGYWSKKEDQHRNND